MGTKAREAADRQQKEGEQLGVGSYLIEHPLIEEGLLPQDAPPHLHRKGLQDHP